MAGLGAFAALAVAGASPALGQEATSVKGMVLSHTDSVLVVRDGAGDKRIKLTPSTRIRGTSGALGVRGEDHPASDLIRGLAVSVTTVHEGDSVTATEVVFKNSDLKTARQISAGLHTTDENVAHNARGIAENAARLDDVGQLVPAGRTKVFFATGSTALSPKGREDLDAIAAQAKDMKTAYRIAVVGRADTTGNAAANQRLSERRAAAVKSYLIKTAGVSPAHFLPATALGDSPIAQDPDRPANNDEARRVTVTIAISKSARPQ
jgi:outer membrane protein OmpA-like peptidoglycan-associated protein